MRTITELQLKKYISDYFETMKQHGRSVSDEIKPEKSIFEKEKQFLDYLDDDDLLCWFCYKHLVVLVIDYKTQRPVWGCLKDRATKGIQKIKWADHCGECGCRLNLNKSNLEDQEKFLDNANVKTVCDKCIGNGNILTDEDMENVHTRKLVN